jgi:hypothetical protein
VTQAEEIEMSGTFSSVPQVDYSHLNDPSTRGDELAKLREAIFVVGFLYLTNTGLEVGNSPKFEIHGQGLTEE